MSTYVVLGATGHTGKPIAFGLLEKGHTVCIVSRHTSTANDLIQKGAKHFAGDSTNPLFLASVFDGAEALYTLIPFDPTASDYTQMQLSNNLLTFCQIFEREKYFAYKPDRI